MTRRYDQDPTPPFDKRKLMRRVAAQAAYFAIGASGVWGGPHVPKIAMEKPLSPNALGVSGVVDNSPELGMALDRMRQHGAKKFRFDIGWPGVEPNAPEGGVHTYNWSGADAAMKVLILHGMTPSPVAGYAAEWASGQKNDFSPPTDPNQYAAFIKQVINRYGETDAGSRGAFWQENPDLPYKPMRQIELWNEINTEQFFRDTGPAPDLNYLRMYKAARAEVNKEHKNVTVVFGSLLDTANPKYKATTYVQQLDSKEKGFLKGVEAIAIHPYYSTAEQVINELIQFRIELNKRGGYNIRIHVTEFGTFDGVATPQQSADMLRKLVGWLNSGCNKEANKIEELTPYGFIGGKGETMPGLGGSYALFKDDSQLTTTGRAFLGAAATATTKPRRRCDPVKDATKRALRNHKLEKRRVSVRTNHATRNNPSRRHVRR